MSVDGLQGFAEWTSRHPGRGREISVAVVTRRGVEIPIGRSKGWSVEAFSRLLGEIDGLPETTDCEERGGGV